MTRVHFVHESRVQQFIQSDLMCFFFCVRCCYEKIILLFRCRRSDRHGRSWFRLAKMAPPTLRSEWLHINVTGHSERSGFPVFYFCFWKMLLLVNACGKRLHLIKTVQTEGSLKTTCVVVQIRRIKFLVVLNANRMLLRAQWRIQYICM